MTVPRMLLLLLGLLLVVGLVGCAADKLELAAGQEAAIAEIKKVGGDYVLEVIDVSLNRAKITDDKNSA